MVDQSPNTKTSDPADSPKQRIYWAPAATYQLANLKPEIKQGGQIIQSEEPLTFRRNIHMTSDLAEIKFIEDSKAFKNGVIVLCKDLAEANAKSSAMALRKTVKTTASSIESMEVHTND